MTLATPSNPIGTGRPRQQTLPPDPAEVADPILDFVDELELGVIVASRDGSSAR